SACLHQPHGFLLKRFVVCLSRCHVFLTPSTTLHFHFIEASKPGQLHFGLALARHIEQLFQDVPLSTARWTESREGTLPNATRGKE
ncbi:MAG TPA: hypothetical protein VFV38_02865, partial [Ktedonobacteraceae bacterium]|nr:hypothetical protein [Ktedonobacteraceae bacterium]